MKKCWLSLVAAGLVLTGLTYLNHLIHGTIRSGSTLSSFGKLDPSIDQELRRAEELEDARAVGQRLLAGKNQVVEELLAGRFDLWEAATRFRDLNSHSPQAEAYLRRELPGVPYEVALCHQVVWHANGNLRLRDSASASVAVARLESEFQEHVRYPRGVRTR
jgi:hypothetical protein